MKSLTIGAKKKLKRERLFITGMMILPVIQFIVFWVYVNFNSIIMGFVEPRTGDFTLRFLKRFFDEFSNKPEIKLAILNTLKYFIVCNFLNLPIIILMAYMLFKKCPGHSVYRVIFFLPQIVSTVVMCTLFIYLAGVLPSGPGPIITMLEKFGVKFSPMIYQSGLLGNNSTAYNAIMAFMLWTGVGTHLILINGALIRIPPDIFEAAQIYGCGMFRELISIVMSLIWPTVSTLFLLGLSGVFIFSNPIMIMTEGAFDTSTIGWYVTKHVLSSAKGNDLQNYPALIGTFVTLIALPFVLIVKKILDKISAVVEF